MKKLLSLLLVLVIIAIPMTFASAATLSGRGMQITLTEDENGLITGVVTLEGAIDSSNSFSLNLAYDNTKVIPLKASDKSKVTANIANAAIADTAALDALFDLATRYESWTKGTSQFRVAASPFFIQFAVATSTDLVTQTSGSSEFARFYFEKIAGQTIDDSTFTFQGTANTYISETVSLKNGSHPDNFAIEVVPYVNVVPVDKDALNAEIADAEILANAVTIGDEAGEYPQSAHETFVDAIVAAKVVADDNDATQEEVDAALATLTAAISAFQGTVIVATDKIKDLTPSWTGDMTVGEGDSITFSGEIVQIADETLEAGIMIGGLKYPAASAPGVVLRGGKFAIEIKGWDSLPAGSYAVKSYKVIGGQEFTDDEYTFTR